VVGITQSAFAEDNPEGQTYSGKGKDKSEDVCAKEAKIDAAKTAKKACEDFCNPQSVSTFKLKEGSETATCAKNGKFYQGSGTVKVEICECTDYTDYSSDPIILDQIILDTGTPEVL
jgi:hypothetical protein